MKNIKLRKVILLFFDIAMFVLSYLLVYYILKANRIFEFNDPATELYYFMIMVTCTTVVRFVFRTYGSIWRYAESMDYLYLISADFFGCLLSFTVMRPIMHLKVPAFFIASICSLSLLLVLLSRITYRQLSVYRQSRRRAKGEVEDKYVAIIGAGAAGVAVLNELKNDKTHNFIPYCFIDTDTAKIGSFVQGVKVVHPDSGIAKLLKESPVTDIIIAIPSADSEKKKRIIKECAATGCKVKMYEYIFDRMEGADKKHSKRLGIRDVKIEDLLSRGVITFENDNVKRQIAGNTIMVTGGGGSIGSELCRQIAANQPKMLIIFDIYENNAYDIQQELRRHYPYLHLEVLIGSVRNTSRVDRVFATYHPDIVYHAAAHKHVPLMEDSPNEAIKNNVFGTYKVALAADKYGTSKFVLISTDKAVNPTNIMGASKRICEMIVQGLSRQSSTEFVAVRFGNVLGSNGSVIPLFKKQIEEGGPVTVTDKRIIRYFMTIPEAVSLVLQAGAFAKGGEIFVLDMGEPVKIDDLARNLIKLSGYVPDEDIKIVYSGLRPGEKLYEEILMDEEGLTQTENELIHIGKPLQFDENEFFDRLQILYEEAYSEVPNMKEIIADMVPTYQYRRNNEKKDKKVIDKKLSSFYEYSRKTEGKKRDGND